MTPVALVMAALVVATLVPTLGVAGRVDLRSFVDRVAATTSKGAARLVHQQGRRGGASSVGDMVVVLDAVARALRGGAGVHEALRVSLPGAGVHRRGLGAVVGSVASGRALPDALVAWRRHDPTPEVALATAVLGFGLHTGGSLARAVDGAAATLRERLALLGEVRVLATQARASAVVVGGAPLGFAALVVAADPRVGGVLLTTPVGWACVVTGVGLEVACVLWMRALVRRTGAT
jgi:tight adherence protein B